MRKRISTKKLSRTRDERKHLAQGFVVDLINHEHIVTTLAKAQFARRITEKLVTLAKKQTLASRQILSARIANDGAVRKLVDDIAPRFANRNGGYVRLLKYGVRKGDAAQQVAVQWTEKKALVIPPPVTKETKAAVEKTIPTKTNKKTAKPKTKKE